MPISGFAAALRAFQSGRLGSEELSAELDRQLTVDKASPAVLLALLGAQQAAQPLAQSVHDAIAKHLADWPQDPTIATGLRRKRRAPRGVGVGVGDLVQGRFSLVALIGEGGMSRVFKAVDLRRAEAGAADPHVAVKVLTGPLDEYFGSIAALQREAHKLQSLTHPNIVRVIDCDRDGQTVFMTMEYLAGRSLQKILRSAGPAGMDNAAAQRLVTDIGRALEFAHANHIVHGDLKPGNVIVTEQGLVKVIDFGMAQFITHADVEATPAQGEAVPKAITPRYASPEMAAGRSPEPADDVYALACLAYEALSGTHPFGRERDANNRDSNFHLPRPPRLPQHQYAALVKALAYHRKNRTPNIRRFLDEFLAGERHASRRRRAWLGAAAMGCSAAVLLWMRPHFAPASRPVATAAAAAAVPGAVFRDCPACPSMTVLPAGRFDQGGDAGAAGAEQPRHAVHIAQPLAMSTHETTVGEFREFVAATHRELAGCNVYDGHWEYRQTANWEAPGFAQTALHPVVCVSWDDAAAYARWLAATTGYGYRLPSASEWEYAARAGGTATRPWGTVPDAACVDANVADQSATQRYPGWTVFPCTDRYVNTAPVGSFRANAFGLNDLLGNAFEWVFDCWYEDYTDAPADGSARVEPGCAERELRGGSWFSSPEYVTAAYRNRFAADYRSSSVGFRLVRDIER